MVAGERHSSNLPPRLFPKVSRRREDKEGQRRSQGTLPLHGVFDRLDPELLNARYLCVC